MKLPKISDDEAVARLVAEAIEDDYAKRAAQEFYDQAMRDYPPLPMPVVTAASMERAAIADAERGDFKDLADILESGKDLSPKARAMIAAKLRGTFKARRGVAKRDIIQRDLNWKIDAAEEVDHIVAILKRLYPKEKGHTDRAITIAADRAMALARDRTLQFGEQFAKAHIGKVSRQLLDSYYKKSRHRPRRR